MSLFKIFWKPQFYYSSHFNFRMQFQECLSNLWCKVYILKYKIHQQNFSFFWIKVMELLVYSCKDDGSNHKNIRLNESRHRRIRSECLVRKGKVRLIGFAFVFWHMYAVPNLPIGRLAMCLERKILRGAKFWKRKNIQRS